MPYFEVEWAKKWAQSFGVNPLLRQTGIGMRQTGIGTLAIL
jgi:hypothetical protein